jgi:hypothetical protein
MTIPTQPIGSVLRALVSADYLPPAQFGTTDDCGFSPICDDPTRVETRLSKKSVRECSVPNLLSRPLEAADGK